MNRRDMVRSRDPRRAGLEVGPWLGPGLSLLGLLIVAVITVGLFNGQVPIIGGPGPGGSGDGGDGGPIKTPTPSDVIVVDPRSEVPGSITYAKAGNIWIQRGVEVIRLTGSGKDAMPSWSPDGEWIYFIRYKPVYGRFVIGGVLRGYSLQVPQVMRIHPDGSGAEVLLTGLYEKGKQTWSYFIRQPVLSPDLKTLALVSDGPNPLNQDVVLQLYNLAAKKLVSTGAAQNRPLGHQDPAWRPDGKLLLFVKNGREGARGAPMLMRYRTSDGKVTTLAGPGYTTPSWSPDGRWVAATKTDGLGTDVVILDAANGAEVLRVTGDHRSFAGTWSPAGDALVYLHIDRGVVDLVTVKLSGSAPGWTVGEVLPLTNAAGLDGASRPSWFIPKDQLPEPSPTPTPSATPAPSGAASAPPSAAPSASP